MSYKAYITEAIVCGSEEYRTSDRSLLLFTREAGMLFGSARSVREERSKQRYALQDFSYARLTLVRGKGGWRVTGAEAVENIYLNAPTRDIRAFAMRVIELLRRTIRGETPHPRIFDDVIIALCNYRSYDTASLERILMLRILNELGYVSPNPAYASFLENDLTPELVSSLCGLQTAALQNAIEHALIESQL